ncbi:hypothetical protein [Staphylococcus carnosus]|uniref:Uncharacterized protein n=1 Tax=Staphylococcus carnosus TaxID=1281 RepID=A0AAJ0JND2_STACA|nr:hypothetical protein [Staphylococcus carnosus]KKB24965.1 hypothetical protein VV61_07745 [Staphylococcus carnosus]QQS85852.1 hypothetical protein I6J04_03400 [Staphylococcus carnosus]QRQ05787.1 hypothetical protein I6J34_03735 [Staphylococcus carnosus]UTB82221.1 hypothetical protein A2I67_02440 [Staphylococcus carnosus]UTC01131.1 hypothetical protein A7E59_10340 [Staphylococcus carnosus]
MSNFYPSQFAAAYIQTLPSAKKPDDFNNRSDYWEYMKSRRQLFFNEYIEAIEFADSFGSSLDERDKER